MKITIRKRNQIIKKLKREAFHTTDLNGIKLVLTKHTLVPHPDTLDLIELAKKIIKNSPWIKTIADVGTGSGIIAIKLAKIFPDKKILASDISKKVLVSAKKNARQNRVDNVEFFLNTDKVWLSEYKNQKIDLIVSNPPFVGDKEYQSADFQKLYPEVKLEPSNAVRTYKNSCLSPYLKMVKNSKTNKTRMFLFQCNSLHVQKLASKIKSRFNVETKILNGKNGVKRFLFVRLSAHQLHTAQT